MKFLVVLCFLALAAADDDNQDKKNPVGDLTPTSGLNSTPGSLLNSQVFPPTTFPSAVSYTGFDGNIPQIQPVNPNFFTTASTGVPAVVNTPLQAFPVTRTVFQGPSPVVNGAQHGFPVAGGVFPSVVTGLQSQFPVSGGVIPQVTGVPVTGGILDAATAANGAVSGVPAASYRFLATDGLAGLPTQGIAGIPTQGIAGIPTQGIAGLATQALAGIPTQGLQTPQTVGLAGIPAFTSGILPTIGSSVLQGQSLPNGVLKNPTGGATQSIPNVPGNISVPLARAFGQA